MKYTFNLISSFKFVMLCIVLYVFTTTDIQANETEINPIGKLYEFDSASDYNFQYAQPVDDALEKGKLGVFSISGNLTKTDSKFGVDAYQVDGGDEVISNINPSNVTLSYVLGEDFRGVPDSEWHIREDNTKNLNGVKLEDNIRYGAVILQTSNNGVKWYTDAAYTNILGSTTLFKPDFYVTKNIQQINGCFFRIIVVYELEKKINDDLINNKSSKKYAEVYKFYLKNKDEQGEGKDNIRRRVLGDSRNTVKTGFDNGFSGTEPITIDDPHYGWELGQFFIEGYTADRINSNGESVILKNVGDRITLSFRLDQDIDKLNGRESLQVSEDINGYDEYFQVERTNFKRGALILRYIDSENVKHDITYTNFLEANVRTTAETKIELFEEGDYEIALDYELIDNNKYNNYRMFFKFSIRNGDCAFFVKDSKNGSVIDSDNEYLKDGFTIDLAESKYLMINVKEQKLVKKLDGVELNGGFSRVAKDKERFEEAGVYEVSVKNDYIDSPSVKTIYVGDDKYIRAIEKYKREGETSEKALENILIKLREEGYELSENGDLTPPPELMPDTDDDSGTLSENSISEQDHESDSAVSQDEDSNHDLTVSDNLVKEVSNDRGRKIGIAVIVILLLITGIGIAVGVKIKSKKKEQEKL